jgi:hypothetical protein
MKNPIFRAIANTISSLKKLRIDILFTAILVSFVLLVTNVDSRQSDRTSHESVLEEIHEANQSSARPKTTGEFLDEARGDVPLNKRIKNITRDSAEAFKQLGRETSIGARENVRDLKESATQAGKDLSNRDRR